MSVADANKELLQAFWLAKGMTPLAHIAEEIDCNVRTLHHWLTGKNVTLATIQKVEAWLAKHQHEGS